MTWPNVLQLLSLLSSISLEWLLAIIENLFEFADMTSLLSEGDMSALKNTTQIMFINLLDKLASLSMLPADLRKRLCDISERLLLTGERENISTAEKILSNLVELSDVISLSTPAIKILSEHAEEDDFLNIMDGLELSAAIQSILIIPTNPTLRNVFMEYLSQYFQTRSIFLDNIIQDFEAVLKYINNTADIYKVFASAAKNILFSEYQVLTQYLDDTQLSCVLENCVIDLPGYYMITQLQLAMDSEASTSTKKFLQHYSANYFNHRTKSRCFLSRERLEQLLRIFAENKDSILSIISSAGCLEFEEFEVFVNYLTHKELIIACDVAKCSPRIVDLLKDTVFPKYFSPGLELSELQTRYVQYILTRLVTMHIFLPMSQPDVYCTNLFMIACFCGDNDLTYNTLELIDRVLNNSTDKINVLRALYLWSKTAVGIVERTIRLYGNILLEQSDPAIVSDVEKILNQLPTIQIKSARK